MKGNDVSVKDALDSLTKSTINNDKGDAHKLGNKLEVKKSEMVREAPQLIKSEDALNTINKSLDTIKDITKNYTELVKNLVAKAEDKAKEPEVVKSEKIDKAKDCEEGYEDKPKEKKEVAKSEDPNEKEGKEDEEKEDKTEKSEDVAKSFEENDKDKVAKSVVASDEGNLKEDVDELVDVINKSIGGLNEEDDRVEKLETLRKSIKDADNINEDALKGFVEKYQEI